MNYRILFILQPAVACEAWRMLSLVTEDQNEIWKKS